MNLDLNNRTLIEGNGLPLLLIHGAGGPKPIEPLRQGLANHYQVIAPTLLGYLPSDGRIHYSDQLFVDFIEAIRKHLQIEQWMVVGVSLGGRIVLNYACQYQNHASHLVAISAAGLNTIAPAKISFLHPVLLQLFAWILSNPKNLAMLGDEELNDPNDPIVKASIEYMKQLLADPVMRMNFCETLLKTLVRNREWDVKLPTLKIPVCILWGDADRTCPVAGAYLLAKQIKQSQLSILPGYGHMAMLKCSEIIVRHIIEFGNTI
jgi:pimeloyl-ACP methyl ester carboxylesterase